MKTQLANRIVSLSDERQFPRAGQVKIGITVTAQGKNGSYEQPKKLVASLAAVVTLADQPDELSPLLDQLGRSHVGYGVQPHHYPYVAASLLATLADTFGDGWTEEAADTWAQALAVVSERMIAAQRAVA